MNMKEVKDLKDTAEMMTSEDYKERFKAEYHQTKIRYERLKKLNTEIEAVSRIPYGMPCRINKPKHDCPKGILRDQQTCMGEYLHLLELRAVIEGIDL